MILVLDDVFYNGLSFVLFCLSTIMFGAEKVSIECLQVDIKRCDTGYNIINLTCTYMPAL